MSHYQELIREAIASTSSTRTDDATCALVEDWMRIDRSGLDGLSRSEFDALATGCFLDSLAADTEFIRHYCEVSLLDVPEWATRQRSAT